MAAVLAPSDFALRGFARSFAVSPCERRLTRNSVRALNGEHFLVLDEALRVGQRTRAL